MSKTDTPSKFERNGDTVSTITGASSSSSSTDVNDFGGRTDLLLRFFDSAFFDEWIALTYLWKSESTGVRDYLCNRLYKLPLENVERYLIEFVHLALLLPGSSLERCITDLCSRSLRVALKVRWLLAAAAEDRSPKPRVTLLLEECEKSSMDGKWPEPFQSLDATLKTSSPRLTSKSVDAGGRDVEGEGHDVYLKATSLARVDGHERTPVHMLTDEDDSEGPSTSDRDISSQGTTLQKWWWSSSTPDLAMLCSGSPHTSEVFSEFPELSAKNSDVGGAIGRGVVDDVVSSQEVDESVDARISRSRANSSASKSLSPSRKSLDMRPRSKSFSLRVETYYATIDLVSALCEISSELAAIPDRDSRNGVLNSAISDINAELDGIDIKAGPAFPIGKLARLLRFVEKENILLDSKDRAPLLLYAEVLEIEETQQQRQPESRRTKGHTRGHSWSPSPERCKKDLHLIQQQQNLIAEASDSAATGLAEAALVSGWEPLARGHTNRLGGGGSGPMGNGKSPMSGGVDGIATYSRFPDNDKLCQKIDESIATMRKTQEAASRVLVSINVLPQRFSLRRLVGDGDVVKVRLVVAKQHHRVPSQEALYDMAKEQRVPMPEIIQSRPLSPPRAISPPSHDRGSLSPWREQAVAEAALRAEARAVLGERFEQKKERMRENSKHGSHPHWNLRAFIVKSGDDCRQEALACQLIESFNGIFRESELNLSLRPYDILVTSSHSALIEVVTDALSIHAIKKRFPGKTLAEYFVYKYGRGTAAFKNAQRCFVESMAAYSIVSYILQVKDRHNGNLLLDDEGHIVHIDFGFMLSNSPGGVNFETAPFKLTKELLEVMDSNADGAGSEAFDYFELLVVQGFLAVRKHADRILLLIEMMMGSGCPCFKGGNRMLKLMRRRFLPGISEDRCVEKVLGLISESIDNWRTRQYDYYQRVLNSIL